MGEKLRTNHATESEIRREGKNQEGRSQNDRVPYDDPIQRALVTGGDPLDDWVVPGVRALAENVAGEDGRDDDGKQERAQQCERHRPSHGLEEPALDALQ